jgi:hypothetical protein
MKNDTVQIEITAKTLATLIESGLIHAVDFKCLDFDSKRTVWKLFLASINLKIKQENY